MAHKKQGAASKNLKDSNPQYLGIKISDGGLATAGSIIVRQRGTKIVAGRDVGVGKDHTLFALKEGVVKFGSKRKLNFDGTITKRKSASIVQK